MNTHYKYHNLYNIIYFYRGLALRSRVLVIGSREKEEKEREEKEEEKEEEEEKNLEIAFRCIEAVPILS